MSLARAQLGLLAALAATVPVSIFASEVLLALSALLLAARIATRAARFPATRLDTPLVCLMVWTLLAASFAVDPARSHESAKKLVLFALFYVAAEVLSREGDRDRVLGAALFGGLALAGLMVAQRQFLGYDHLDRRPDGFLGHYMSASGVTMGVLLLAVARAGFGPRTRPRLVGFVVPLLVLAGVGAVAAATAAGHGIVATRLCVAALAAAAAALALSRRPALRAAEAALPAVTVPVAAWALVASQTRSAWVGALVGLAALARLAFGPRSRPRAVGFALPALVLAGVGAVAAATAAGHGVAATRACVAALGALAAAVALSRSAAVGAAGTALPAVTVPVAAWALVASQTRSAWVGALAGLVLLALLRAPRLLWLVGGAILAVLVLRPAAVTDRLTIGDASSRDRYYMWQAGLDMVLDKPVFGQGPGMILAEYPRYRWPEATHPMQPHLHNNLLQVAAERGLPALAFLLWWAIVAIAAALREARRTRASADGTGWPAAGALAALTAVFAAGLFEYNLGDSEVLMLCLLFTAVPFALARERAAAA